METWDIMDRHAELVKAEKDLEELYLMLGVTSAAGARSQLCGIEVGLNFAGLNIQSSNEDLWNTLAGMKRLKVESDNR